MANEEQLRLLKQSADDWNRWRVAHKDVEIDLEDADLNEANLELANLVRCNLKGAKIRHTYLRHARLWFADLRGADLCFSDLVETDLRKVNLSGADIKGARLMGANLTLAELKEADFNQARFELTILGDVDLSTTKELDKVDHGGPSILGTSALEKSKGKIPEAFLRGCGLSDWEIESAKLYQPGLSPKEIGDILYRVHDLRATQAIQINPLFISYSHKDSTFVDVIENKLNEKGIRCWRDIHNATSGRLEKVVDRAMRQNPTVLLVLSEHSVQSDWVEHEARSARDLEKELKRDVLCPVALDDAWKDCPWPARLREQIMEYNILDFSNWKDDAEFTRKFSKLVEGLDLFYKE